MFGGKRRGLEAAEADLQSSVATVDATRVTLAAEVARNYVELRGFQARLAIAQSNLATQSETLQLTQWRAQAGLVGSLDVEQARANREQTRSQIPLLQTSVAEAEHRVAILLGTAPTALHGQLAAAAPIPQPPTDIAVGIPADLLRQRPDIRAAERTLAAETARIGQAEAARYPSFNLSGSIGLEALSLHALTSGATVTRSLLAGISAPVFDAGRLRQLVEIQSAVRDSARVAYEATVLTALEEVENALVAFANARERSAALAEAVDAARNAALLARYRYTGGLIDFQTVLDTQRSLRAVEDSLSASEADARAGGDPALQGARRRLAAGAANDTGTVVEPTTKSAQASPATAQAEAARVDDLLGPGAARPLWRRPLWWGGAVLVLLALTAGLAWWQGQRGDEAPRYVTEPVARGDLTVTVTANGTLQPTRSVNVGSELSGTVARVLVDINDRVKKGQVLVELDTAKLNDQISRSRASLASSEAKVAQAAATFKEASGNLGRMQEVQRLSGGKVPSQAELETAQATLDRALADQAAARAAVADARAALSSDETNLGKASIRSPINGVVLTRAVDPGNAVAASLQAVTLFTLAEDLTKMKLQVNVDEADVGQVREGQGASFTVSAYPNRKYPAKITRVGYGATTKDNVVTYVAELEVANTDLSLRPGMTATATITAAQRSGVLLVPNAALRFTPAVAANADGAAPAAPASKSGGIVSQLMPRGPRAGSTRKATIAPSTRQVWVLRDGAAVAVPVTPGLSDGRRTEVESDDLREGEAVITDQGAPTS